MSLRRSFAWVTLSQLTFFVLQFGCSVVVARLLSPYEMGVYAIAAATTGIISTVQAFGLTSWLIREPVLTPALLSTAFTMNIIIDVAVSVVISVASMVAAWLYRDPGIAHVMIMLALTTLVSTVQFLPASLMQRQEQFRQMSLVNIMQTCSATLVTLVLALYGFSYMSLAWGTLAGMIVSAAGFNVLGREHASFRLGLSEWRPALRFGTQMLAVSGLNTIASRASEMCMARLLGLDALGLYSRASSLNNLLWDKIHMVIGRVLLVDLAGRKRGGGSLRSAYLRIVEIVTALLWPAFAGMAVLAGPLIQMIYGEKWVAAAPPLSMLAAAAIVLVAITMTSEVFVVCGETARQARLEGLRTGVGLLMFVAGCCFGVGAAAASRIMEALFSVRIYRAHLNRMTDTTTADLLRIYRRSALLTLAATSPAAVLMFATGWSVHVPALEVALAIVLGLAFWLAGLALAHHPIFVEIMRLTRMLHRFEPRSTVVG